MKAFMPAGFMIANHDRSIAVVLCSGTGEQQMLTIPFDKDDTGKGAVDKQQCHATALDKAASGGTDPLLLAAAIAFVLALGFAGTPARLRPTPRFLYPPRRGPPALA